ncbi:OmpH family outer membrane protein [Sphingomonas oryzagri]
MGNTFRSVICAALISGAAMPAMAASDTSVLVVDFDQLLSNSAAAQSGTTQLRAKYDPQTASTRTAYTSAVQAYNTQAAAAKKAKAGASPSPALQQAAQRVEQMQQQAQALNQQINQAAAYVRQQIVDHVRPIAEQMRAERKASVVISKSAALASDPNADITSTLIQRLNSSFPQPSITPPQQPAPAAAPAR